MYQSRYSDTSRYNRQYYDSRRYGSYYPTSVPHTDISLTSMIRNGAINIVLGHLRIFAPIMAFQTAVVIILSLVMIAFYIVVMVVAIPVQIVFFAADEISKSIGVVFMMVFFAVREVVRHLGDASIIVVSIAAKTVFFAVSEVVKLIGVVFVMTIFVILLAALFTLAVAVAFYCEDRNFSRIWKWLDIIFTVWLWVM